MLGPEDIAGTILAKDENPPDLTVEQKEIIKTWNGLNPEERERLMKIIRTFQ